MARQFLPIATTLIGSAKTSQLFAIACRTKE
jgi:hypothetical protein